MHTEIFNNIDLLVEMAGSTLNPQDIEAELISINKEIQDKKQRLEDLKSMMNDTRYFNASSELIDKNIEVSLKSKISRLNRKIKELDLEHNQTKKEENKCHIELQDLKEKIDSNKKYIEKIQDKALNGALSTIVANEKNHLQYLEEELERKEEHYQEILKQLELHDQALKELIAKKEADEERLRDVEDNLSNPNAYVDEDLKKRDEEQFDRLNENLEELQKRKLVYLTDPNMIGADAKEFVLNHHVTEALNKIKELLTIVKSKPFMDVSNLSVLDEELEKKENERTEFANYIDSKDYKGLSSDVVHQRITYLNDDIARFEKEIEQLEVSKNEIDQNINANLSVLIQDLEAELAKINSVIEEYEMMLKDSSKSRKTKANLENAIFKKEKEKEVMNQLLDHYKEDLLFQVMMSHTVQKMIEKYQNRILDYKNEFEELNHVSIMDEVSKDYIEEEKDKEHLKKINEEIKQIKERKKYSRTPDEIYDQIEMLLASDSVRPNVKTDSKKEEETMDGLIDDLFQDEKKEEAERIRVVEMIPAQTVQSTSGGTSYGA